MRNSKFIALLLALALVLGSFGFAFADEDQPVTISAPAEETAASALPSVQAAAAFNYGLMAMNVIERLFAMLLHIGLTVIVYYGVVNSKKGCLPAAVLLHMLMDTFPALYQRGAVPLWSVELWGALVSVLTVFVATKLYGKMKE